jgi:cysteine desulfurase
MEYYLDHAATTKPCPAAVTALQRCLTTHYGNPSSLHQLGVAAQKEVEQARATLAAALGCNPQEIVFTSGATESSHLALTGAVQTYGKRKKKIVVSAVEHASVRNTLQYLGECGYEIVTVAPDKNGCYHAADFLNAIDAQTCLLSMMMVNNETGYCLPVQTVFRTAKRKFPELITHCDAVQGFLKVPFQVRTLQADLVSISGHKIHGVKGTGALYHRNGVHLHPTFHGGSQENGLRPGTESVPLIAAFGAAVQTYGGNIKERYAIVAEKKTYLLERLQQLPNIKIHSAVDASPYIISFSMRPYRSEIMLHFLEKRGVFVSSGSACSKGKNSGIPVLFGATEQEADSILRVSLSSETPKEALDALIDGLSAARETLLY